MRLMDPNPKGDTLVGIYHCSTLFGRHPGGYIPLLFPLWDTPWWVYTVIPSLGGTLVGIHHCYTPYVPWWVYTTVIHPMYTLVGIPHPEVHPGSNTSHAPRGIPGYVHLSCTPWYTRVWENPQPEVYPGMGEFST